MRSPVPVLVLDPEVPFEQVDRVLRDLGMEGGPTTVLAPLLPGEPEAAAWSRGAAVVTYSFEPAVAFRELRGNAASDPRWPLLAERLSHLDVDDVRGLLRATADDEVALGLLATRAMGLTRLAPMVELLQGHRTPVVARIAERVTNALGDLGILPTDAE